MENEVRKLPRKTVIIVSILILLGVIWFIVVSYGQSVKATEVIHKLGYSDVSNVRVYAKHQFLREDINVKGFKYSVSFIDNTTNQHCKGFVLKDFKQNVEKDLICQKIDN